MVSQEVAQNSHGEADNLVPNLRQPAPSSSQIGAIGRFTTEARESTTESPAWGR
jgi:hypothetical protein